MVRCDCFSFHAAEIPVQGKEIGAGVYYLHSFCNIFIIYILDQEKAWRPGAIYYQSQILFWVIRTKPKLFPHYLSQILIFILHLFGPHKFSSGSCCYSQCYLHALRLMGSSSGVKRTSHKNLDISLFSLLSLIFGMSVYACSWKGHTLPFLILLSRLK